MKNEARTYKVRLTGVTPLLLHHDNLSWADTMEKWRKDPANKDGSKAGDDRTPAWRWIGCLYQENGLVVIPSDNLMTVIREGGKRCPVGGGKKGTFKSQSQSGLVVDQSAWPIEVGGKLVSYKEHIKPLLDRQEADFEKHEQAAAAAGFTLFVKRAKIGMAKHVRVRPRFDVWACEGTVTVFDDMIDTGVIQNIFTHSGSYSGMGDWRPSSPKSPGSFGRFTATIKQI